MEREFYVVLGVSPDADMDQIRSAYRKLVKLYRPGDQSAPVPEGPGSEADLADDRQADAPEAGPDSDQVFVDRSQRPAVIAHTRQDARPLAEQADGLFTELDEFFEGWVPGLFRTSRSTPRRKDLFVELALAPSEARAGGMIPLQIPVEQRCPECNGLATGGLACAVCGGRGRVVDYHSIEVSIPPGVEDGTQARIPLGDVGLPAADLHVLVSIE